MRQGSGIGRRVRALTALFVVALAVTPATALGVTQVIPGNGSGPGRHNLTIYVGDNGQLQAKAADAFSTVEGMFFGTDHGPASQHNHLRLERRCTPRCGVHQQLRAGLQRPGDRQRHPRLPLPRT